MIRPLFLLLLLFAGPAHAQSFPQLTGRVVDQADLLPPDHEAALTQRLEALQQATSRQLVVATVSSLEGYEIEDYGYRLGRQWGIGQQEANNGVILLVAPNERKVRIEVGYGLEGIMTDALSGQIVRNDILPYFRGGDYRGGIDAGVEAILAQLQAPPEAAEQRVLEAQQAAGGGDGGGSVAPLVVWLVVLGFMAIPFMTSFSGQEYHDDGRRRRRRRRRGAPVVIWGPGTIGGSSDSSSSWGGSSWGSGGGSWGGGGGGFSGGGGSFGGGGASGGW